MMDKECLCDGPECETCFMEEGDEFPEEEEDRVEEETDSGDDNEY